MNRRDIIRGALIGALLFTLLDLGLRKQQNMECERGDTVPCFDHASWLSAALSGGWR